MEVRNAMNPKIKQSVINEIIGEQIGEALEKNGFVLDAASSSSEGWIYERAEANTVYCIIVQTLWREALRATLRIFEFGKMIGGAELQRLVDLDHDKYHLGEFEYFCFHNEETLARAASELSDALNNYADAAFELILKEKDRPISPELLLQRELFTRHDALLEAGRARYHLSASDSYEKVLARIDEEIKLLPRGSLEAVSERLLELGAIYADLFIRRYAMEWKWLERACGGLCLLAVPGLPEECDMAPLGTIINEWKYPERMMTVSLGFEQFQYIVASYKNA